MFLYEFANSLMTCGVRDFRKRVQSREMPDIPTPWAGVVFSTIIRPRSDSASLIRSAVVEKAMRMGNGYGRAEMMAPTSRTLD
jgi:hypothetical protein